jgi:hypothetical protein
MSVLHVPTLKSIELTIYIYRLDVGDRYKVDDFYDERPYGWACHRWWYNLAQVSRRWRYLILGSRSLLDLHLFCTDGVPVMDVLANSPPLPLIISHLCHNDPQCSDMEGEEGLLLALSGLLLQRPHALAHASSSNASQRARLEVDGQ